MAILAYMWTYMRGHWCSYDIPRRSFSAAKPARQARDISKCNFSVQLAAEMNTVRSFLFFIMHALPLQSGTWYIGDAVYSMETY